MTHLMMIIVSAWAFGNRRPPGPTTRRFPVRVLCAVLCSAGLLMAMARAARPSSRRVRCGSSGRISTRWSPGPPKALTDKLFNNPDSPSDNAIGLYKLEFYSPQYFKLFPRVFRMDDADGGWTFCGRMPKPPGMGG